MRIPVGRRLATWATALALAAVGLAVVAPRSATASCAGPQLALEQSNARIEPRRVGDGDDQKLLYDVRRDQSLRLLGSNLTFGCQDTYSSTQRGCGSPVPDSVDVIVPMTSPDVVLTQRGRTWTLARAVAVGSDLTAQVEVKLPSAVQPGAAELSLVDPKEGAGPRLDLVLGR